MLNINCTRSHNSSKLTLQQPLVTPTITGKRVTLFQNNTIEVIKCISCNLLSEHVLISFLITHDRYLGTSCSDLSLNFQQLSRKYYELSSKQDAIHWERDRIFRL